jgi:hypothetical protein
MEMFFAEDEKKDALKAQEPAVEAKVEKKVNQPRNTITVRPAECAGCSKNMGKILWYYRNNKYYCNITCYKKKITDDAKKAAESAK